MLELTPQHDFTALLSQPLVLVDFWALWCAPCRAMLPSLERIAEQYSELQVVKVNADHFPELLAQHQVRGLPALLLFSQGQELQRTHETLTYKQLQQWLSAFLTDQVAYWLEKAAELQGDEQLLALRQAVHLGPTRLMAQEALLAALFNQRQNNVLAQELAERIACLPPELLRSPVLSRIYSVLKFAQGLGDQPPALHNAYLLAIHEHYSEALEQLLTLRQSEGELATLAQALMIRIIDLMPDRKLAQQYRRRLQA